MRKASAQKFKLQLELAWAKAPVLLIQNPALKGREKRVIKK
jgi:hypothetical protein